MKRALLSSRKAQVMLSTFKIDLVSKSIIMARPESEGCLMTYDERLASTPLDTEAVLW